MAHPVHQRATPAQTKVCSLEEQARSLLFGDANDGQIRQERRVNHTLDYFFPKIIERANSADLEKLLEIAIDQESVIRLKLLIRPLLYQADKMEYALRAAIVKGKAIAFQMLLVAESVSEEMLEVALCESAARRNLDPSALSQASYLSVCGKELAKRSRSGESPSFRRGFFKKIY